MSTLTSPSNPKIKQVRALRQRKQRAAAGMYVVEGIHPVGEALSAGASVEYLCYAPDLLTSDFARGLIQQQERRGLPCFPVAKELFSTLADKENPQGLLAVVRQNPAALGDLNPGNFPWGVALVQPQDPGNIGTILRTIDAVGASGLLLLDSSADPYHPSAVRASMGALFWHPLAMASFDEFTEWASRHAYHVFGSSAHASLDYRAVEVYPEPLILLLGSERQGLSREEAAICEEVINLPMRGRASSLNLAVAAGVLLYAILDRQAPNAG